MDKKIDDLTVTAQERQKAFAGLEDEQLQLWEAVLGLTLKLNSQPQNAILTLQQQISQLQDVETLRQAIKNYRKVAKDIKIQMQGVPAQIVLIQNNVNGFCGGAHNFMECTAHSKERMEMATELLRKLDACTSGVLNMLDSFTLFLKELNPVEIHMDALNKIYSEKLIEILYQIQAMSIPYNAAKECFARFNTSVLVFPECINSAQNCKTKAGEYLEETNISLNAIKQKIDVIIQSMGT